MRERWSKALALLLLVAQSSRAEPGPVPPNQDAMNKFDEICSLDSTGTYFPVLLEEAIAARNRLCKEHADTESIFSAVSDFVNRARLQRLSSSFGGFTNKQADAPLQDPIDAAWSGIRSGVQPEVPRLAQTLDDLEIEVAGEVFRVADVARCEAEARARAAASFDGSGSCQGVVEELIEIFNVAQSALASPLALEFAEALLALDADWQLFLTEMRGQTLLELVINSKLYRRNYERQTAGFTPPPNRQLIVLHPSLVIEDVGNASDGENTKEALMLELVGVNWWRKSARSNARTLQRFTPSGFSLISVYADRPDVADAGFGVALHFDSVYTIGFTMHDSDGGVLVSFDLLKLLQDKEKALQEYRR